MTDIDKLEDRVRAAVQPVDDFYRQNGLGLYRSELSVTHKKYPYYFQWLAEKNAGFDNELVRLITQYLQLEEAKLEIEVAEVFITRAYATSTTFEDNLEVVFAVDVEMDVRFDD